MRISGMCLLLFIGFYSSAQNLVPNYSFEIDTACPMGAGEIYKAPPWIDPTAPSGDYFNECASISSTCSIPVNFAGHQWPRTGKGYAGILFYGGTADPNDREYLQVKLSDSLVSGRKYCVGYYVSLGEASQVGINGFSAYFSSNSVSCPGCFLPYTPQINYTGSPIIDTVNWVLISGSLIASGGEKYMTIGNFNADSNTSTQLINGSGGGAYYYIDDVSVVEITPAEAGNNITLCNRDSVQLGSSPIINVTYSWSPTQGLSNPYSANPKASPQTTTTYTFTQTQCNVVSTSTVTVTVEDCEAFVPTAFSPNHDGHNDLLFVYSHVPLNSMDFAIYDRWGEKVFETTNQQTGWDGTYHGKDLNNAVFVYVLHATQSNGTIINKKGNISLIR